MTSTDLSTRVRNREAVIEIWRTVLDLDGSEISDEDHFFRLGGHSLLMIRMIHLLNEAMGVEIEVQDVSSQPTVGAIVELLERTSRSERTPASVEGTPTDPPFFPLLPAQVLRAAKIRSRPSTGQAGPHENYAAAFRLHGHFDSEVLRKAVWRVLERHDALRVRVSPDGLSGSVAAIGTVDPVSEVNLRHRDILDLLLAIRGEVLRAFDLDSGLLLRTTLFRLSSDESILTIVASSFAWDGWASREIFVRDLSAEYAAMVSDDHRADLAAPSSFARYCIERAHRHDPAREAELWSYWLEVLRGIGPVPEFRVPGSAPVPPISDSRASARIFRKVAPDVVQDLRRAERSTTLFTIGIAAIFLLLHQYYGDGKVGVLAPSGNRTARGSEQIVGPFAHFIVLVAEIPPGATVGTVLRLAQESTAEAQRHAGISHEELVARLLPDVSAGADGWPVRTATFAVEFESRSTPLLGNLQAIPEPIAGQQLENISLWLVRKGSTDSEVSIEVAAQYDLSWLQPNEIEDLMADFETALEYLVRAPDVKASEVSLRLVRGDGGAAGRVD